MTDNYDLTAELIARGNMIRPHGDALRLLTKADLIDPGAWTNPRVVYIADLDGAGPSAFFKASLDIAFGASRHSYLCIFGVIRTEADLAETLELWDVLMAAELIKSVVVETPNAEPWLDLWRGFGGAASFDEQQLGVVSAAFDGVAAEAAARLPVDDEAGRARIAEIASATKREFAAIVAEYRDFKQLDELHAAGDLAVTAMRAVIARGRK